MARESIDKASTRRGLEVRREPYWGAPVERGLYIGFRSLGGGQGSWIARWRNEEGRQQYFSVGPVSQALDYEAAKSAARQWMKAAAAGVDTGNVRTVADACRDYVTDRRKAKGEGTAHDAEQRFNRTVFEATIGSIPLAKISQRRLESWRDGLLVATEDRKPLSKASANRTLTTLKAALNLAVSRRHVAPERALEWALVKPYKDANKRRELFLDLAQRRALLAQTSGGIRNLMEGVAVTGARAGELTSLKRGKFDHRTGSVTLKGKTGERTVPLGPSALALFSRLAQSKLPEAFMFTRDDGKPWAHSDWDEHVREAGRAAKLPPGVCLYTLRHSFITDAIQGGLTPLEVARLVGTSLVMIDKHYGHLAASAARERLALVAFI